MAWDYDRSLERIKQKHAEVADVQVSKLTREMDFDNIALNRPKRVHGAHIYVEIPNFPDIVGRNLEDGCEPELLRRLRLHARELTKVCETDFPRPRRPWTRPGTASRTSTRLPPTTRSPSTTCGLPARRASRWTG